MHSKRVFCILSVMLILTLVFSACGPATEEVVPTEMPAAESSQEEPAESEPTEEVEIQSQETPTEGSDQEQADQDGPAVGGIAIVGLHQEPDNLNPFLRTSIVSRLVGDFLERGLVKILPDGSYGPDLAKEAPSVQNGGISDDGLTVTYNLKEGIKWSDGEPFTCDDIVYTWETIMNPESGAVTTAGYSDIESITCPDPNTAVLQYSNFYAPQLGLFSMDHTMLPKHLELDPAAMIEWETNRSPVGLGPYVLQEWRSGDQMTLVRNENYEYWPTENKPYLDSVVFRFLDSVEVGKQLIQTGEIDILWNLTEADVPDASSWDGVSVSITTGGGVERLVLNMRDPEVRAPCREALLEDPMPHWALGDPAVREAIELSIDKQLIVDELLSGGTTVATFENIGSWAKPDFTPSEYNTERAKEVLEGAGWIDQDGDNIRECHGCAYAEEGRPLKLKIQTTAGNKLREQSEQVMSDMLLEAGIDLYIENVDSAEIFGSWESGSFRRTGQYDIMLYTAGGGFDPQAPLFKFYHSSEIPCDDNNGKGSNYNRYIDEEVDGLLELAGSTPDLAVRKQAYLDMAEIIVASRNQIFLYDRAAINAISDRVQGWEAYPWVSWNVEEWWIR